MASSRLTRFGVFELDLSDRELRKKGVKNRLQDQPFRVLEALLEQPGRIVSREQLKERLWSDDDFVEFDKSLNTAIQKVRQALGDSAAAPQFVETVPRHGYRFIASVQAHEPVPPATAKRPERLALVALALITLALGGYIVAAEIRSRTPER